MMAEGFWVHSVDLGKVTDGFVSKRDLNYNVDFRKIGPALVSNGREEAAANSPREGRTECFPT